MSGLIGLTGVKRPANKVIDKILRLVAVYELVEAVKHFGSIRAHNDAES